MKFKFYAWLILLLLCSMLFGQGIADWDTRKFFSGDSTKSYTTADGKAYAYFTDSGTDTVQSNTVYFNQGGNDITFWCTITNLSGTLNTKVQLGAYGGPEYGFEWFDMVTTTTDSTFYFNTAEQSWGPNLISLEYAVRIVRTGTQRNRYTVRAKQFRR